MSTATNQTIPSAEAAAPAFERTRCTVFRLKKTTYVKFNEDNGPAFELIPYKSAYKTDEVALLVYAGLEYLNSIHFLNDTESHHAEQIAERMLEIMDGHDVKTLPLPEQFDTYGQPEA